ncbi:MAG: hypothetical protein KAX49_11605 [Halanaerobiales bacterium]|nr:hypothetical protein [Halanaerobiales bacterium]
MKRFILVFILISVLILTGCNEGKKLSPKEFIQASYITTSTLETDKIGQTLSYDLELELSQEARDLITGILQSELDTFGQLPFFMLMQKNIKGNLTLDLKYSQEALEFFGELNASFNAGMIGQSFKTNFFVDPNTGGGVFYSMDLDSEKWSILVPSSIFQEQFNTLEIDLEDLSQIKTWEDMKKTLSESEIAYIESLVKIYMDNLNIVSDVSEESIRTIKGEMYLAPLYLEMFNLFLESDLLEEDHESYESIKEFKESGILEEIETNMKAYAEDIKIEVTWVANEKTMEVLSLGIDFKIDKNNIAIQEFSKLIGLEETLDVALNLKISGTFEKLPDDTVIRPANFTTESEKMIVKKYQQMKLEETRYIIDMLGEMIEEYYIEYNEYPETLEEALQYSFVFQIPQDPFTLMPYKYEVDHEGYQVYSAGADGKYHTEDDIIKSGKF